jgi:peptide-methionine (S)-S-oxide reductase
MFGMRKSVEMVDEASAIPGQTTRVVPSRLHLVLRTSLTGPYKEGTELAYFGLGCFWGAERAFWTLPGIVTTAVGYQGGFTENPTYEEVCTGNTGHTEIVLVAFDPNVISYETLLSVFFENHDPTQGMRQGNDIGTQYRSAIYTTTVAQAALAQQAAAMFEERLMSAKFGPITTEIAEAKPFYFAEDYHQQYLEANPFGYCGLAGTGVSCPVGLFEKN